MWIKREERKVMALIEDHLAKVEESLQSMLSALESYLDSNMDSAEAHTSEAYEAESEADEIRREIADLLHEGAFLPIFREDMMKFVNAMDEIAARAEECCDFITIQRPEIPETISDGFLKLARDSVEILSPLKEATQKLSEDFSTSRAKAGEVHAAESEVDDLEREISRQIFSTNLSLAQKMHLKHLVDLMADITDIAEDVAEILETAIAKKNV